MKRFLSSVLSTAIIATFALATIASPADAKACRDTSGKFAKYPPAVSGVAMGPKKSCRDAHGHVATCGSMKMDTKAK